ncbi:MAG: thermonuclease family protein [Xanthobacteraceae bacterium]|jgi:endonuclease YncB( thermonuclease family)
MKRLVLLLSCCALLTVALLAVSHGTRLPRAKQLIAATRVAEPVPAVGAISGRAHVIDGDSLKVAGTQIRVFGIDAPEWRQRCRRADGHLYRCGRWAFRALAQRLRSAPVRCVPRARDRFARLVATCYQGNDDLAHWLVAQGLALDWPRYSGGTYADAEDAARRAERGLWQGAFVRPWEWRHGASNTR